MVMAAAHWALSAARRVIPAPTPPSENSSCDMPALTLGPSPTTVRRAYPDREDSGTAISLRSPCRLPCPVLSLDPDKEALADVLGDAAAEVVFRLAGAFLDVIARRLVAPGRARPGGRRVRGRGRGVLSLR